MATYMPLQDLQLTIVGECTSSIQETVSECEHEIVCPTKTLILEDSTKEQKNNKQQMY